MLLGGAELHAIVIFMKECGCQTELVCCGHDAFPHLRWRQKVAEFQRHVALFGARHTHRRVRHLQHDRLLCEISRIRVLGLKNGAIPIIAAAHPQLITWLANAVLIVSIVAIIICYRIYTKV